MQRLFLGIYGAILLSIFLVLAVSYYALESLNEYRYRQHLQRSMSGTVHLLMLGAGRQQGGKQKKWLTLASSLMNADISIRYSREYQEPVQINSKGSPAQDKGTERFVIRRDTGSEGKQLVIEFEGLTEQVVTATAFFLLNELGRHAEDQRQKVFDNISTVFPYPVFRAQRRGLKLDSKQLGRLRRGETIVEWDKQFGRSLSVNVYAPWGKSRDVLAMGPIEFFDPYPAKIVIPFFLAALLLIAASVMLIIRHLADRLYGLQAKVDAISPAALAESDLVEEPDVIAQLNLKIQNMAERIKGLLGEKAHMIRAVSHDLRTPIAKIHFRLESMADHLGKDNPVLRGCRNDLIRLNQLIDELLTYEKLSVKQDFGIQKVCIGELIKQQLDSLHIFFPKLAMSIETQLEMPFLIEGSEALLNRLLENLLNNAGRFACRRIRVSLRLSQRQDKLQLIIDDDGRGLDEALIPQLFNPFVRGHADSSNSSSGYGLGLAIVKQISMQHHASIAATNNDWGGARFIFRIPLLQPEHQKEQNEKATA